MNREAAVRAADVMLRANGVRDVMLRMFAPATAGSQAEELGLVTPEFQDLPLGAVAMRKAGSETELVVSGMIVEAIVGTLQFMSAKLLFLGAVGVVIDGAVYAVKNCVAMRADDAVYAYRVVLTPPQV